MTHPPPPSSVARHQPRSLQQLRHLSLPIVPTYDPESGQWKVIPYIVRSPDAKRPRIEGPETMPGDGTEEDSLSPAEGSRSPTNAGDPVPEHGTQPAHMPVDDGITHEERHAPMGKRIPQKVGIASAASENASNKKPTGGSAAVNGFSASRNEEERQKAMMVHLVPLGGSTGTCPEIERILTRDKPDILIGRQRSSSGIGGNGVTCAHESCSRRHLMVSLKAKLLDNQKPQLILTVRDLSKSGSYLNGRKMKRHSLVELSLGDVLHITNNTAGDDLDAEVGWRVADASTTIAYWSSNR
ncbi:hypothetical protein FOZ62_019122 [Perkinsus olseni]|nr:hypothetical protein FOZ62_019122 [Perkinsus olseni]